MFLNRLLERNPALAEFALYAHGKGLVLPDTYMIDVDTVRDNAVLIKKEADAHGLKLYFMLKQLGRNPLVAAVMDMLGYAGAVTVDYREALLFAREKVSLGNVGHLVQTPRAAVSEIIKHEPEIMTVYTVEKAAEIAEAARAAGRTQKLMLRVTGDGDMIYSGQECGFSADEALSAALRIGELKGVSVSGVCSFPCFLYDEDADAILPVSNADTVRETAALLRKNGFNIEQVNMPSASCTQIMASAASLGATHLEPGHALSGTTPWHAAHPDAPERPAYVYISEVSHHSNGGSLCYGGGHYRRSRMESAIVGASLSDAAKTTVIPPSDESIDYHLLLKGRFPVSSGVLMCFRTQMFVTRSGVAAVTGLADGRPKIEGIYSPLGQRIER